MKDIYRYAESTQRLPSNWILDIDLYISSFIRKKICYWNWYQNIHSKSYPEKEKTNSEVLGLFGAAGPGDDDNDVQHFLNNLTRLYLKEPGYSGG